MTAVPVSRLDYCAASWCECDDILDERPGHRAPRVRFEQEVEDHLSDNAAEETLDAVIDWGRYAEIFAYDDQAEMFSLEDPKG